MAVEITLAFIGFIIGSIITSLFWYAMIMREDRRNEDLAFKSELIKTIKEIDI